MIRLSTAIFILFFTFALQLYAAAADGILTCEDKTSKLITSTGQ